jgi:photosystem II stability/assembly factor-like uncharacterized protein
VILLCTVFFVVRYRTDNSDRITVLKAADYQSLAISPANPDVLYFGYNDGVMRSIDGGQSWRVLVNRPNFNANDLVFFPPKPSEIYAAGPNFFMMSVDSGISWTPVFNDLPSLDIRGFTINPDPPYLFYTFVAGHGLYKSENAARTWQLLTGKLPADTVALAAVGDTIFAYSQSTGIMRSSDGGQNWATVLKNTGAGAISTIVIDPVNRRNVYAAGASGLYKSADAGASWDRMAYPEDSIATLAISHSDPNILFAITVKDGQGVIYRSENGGIAWARMSK